MAKEKQIKKTSDLIFDNKNINRHTEHGMQMLKNSIEKNGIGRSILIDKNNTIIAGNGVAEVTADKPVRIIETNGDEVIAIKRMDIDIDTDKGRNLALADNVISRVNFNPDQEILTALNDDYKLEEDIFDAVYVEVEPGISENVSAENFGETFTLNSGEKSNFEQITFTIAKEQAIEINNAISEIKKTEEYKYVETFANENSNGNALYLLIMQWKQIGK